MTDKKKFSIQFDINQLTYLEVANLTKTKTSKHTQKSSIIVKSWHYPTTKLCGSNDGHESFDATTEF